MKRRTKAPGPVDQHHVGADPGPLEGATDSISPATIARCRGTNAAMAVVVQLTS